MTIWLINHCFPKAMSFFSVIQQIYSSFSASTKRWQVSTKHMTCLTVKPLSITCQESRVKIVKVIRCQCLQIRKALIRLVNDKENAKINIYGETFKQYNLQNFELILVGYDCMV